MCPNFVLVALSFREVCSLIPELPWLAILSQMGKHLEKKTSERTYICWKQPSTVFGLMPWGYRKGLVRTTFLCVCVFCASNMEQYVLQSCNTQRCYKTSGSQANVWRCLCGGNVKKWFYTFCGGNFNDAIKIWGFQESYTTIHEKGSISCCTRSYTTL